ncbi:hypothetical protein Zmor_005112 [Zophobas morio]|uniref:Uncharacterized protein n=1 Tax=Zophobas morio TaxID=2755281 RepID=A0AA38IMG3_9CUCU|nr:hypothetical protein Zmor_005112 [Zophobas morio]
MVKGIVEFLNYWYFRYLLVTELYMVEKWERVMFHIVLLIILSILSLFNTTVVVSLVSPITQSLFIQSDLQEGIPGVRGEL